MPAGSGNDTHPMMLKACLFDLDSVLVIGEADVPGADGPLDIGVFAHRSSARFLDFKVVQ